MGTWVVPLGSMRELDRRVRNLRQFRVGVAKKKKCVWGRLTLFPSQFPLGWSWVSFFLEDRLRG